MVREVYKGKTYTAFNSALSDGDVTVTRTIMGNFIVGQKLKVVLGHSDYGKKVSYRSDHSRYMRAPTSEEKKAFEPVDRYARWYLKNKQINYDASSSENEKEESENEKPPASSSEKEKSEDESSEDEPLQRFVDRVNKEKNKRIGDANWHIYPTGTCNEAREYKVEGYAVDGHCRTRPGRTSSKKPRTRKKPPKKRLNMDQKKAAWRLEPPRKCDEKNEYKVKGYVVSGHCRRRPNIEQSRVSSEEDGQEQQSASETESFVEEPMQFGQDSLDEKESDPVDEQKQDGKSKQTAIVISDANPHETKHHGVAVYEQWIGTNTFDSVLDCLHVDDCAWVAPSEIIEAINLAQDKGAGNLIVNTRLDVNSGLHWLLVMIDKVQIRVFDPMTGNDDSPAMQRIRARFPAVKYSPTGQQHDTWSCGWRVIYWAFMRSPKNSPPDNWYVLVPLLDRLYAANAELDHPTQGRPIYELIDKARLKLRAIEGGGRAIDEGYEPGGVEDDSDTDYISDASAAPPQSNESGNESDDGVWGGVDPVVDSTVFFDPLPSSVQQDRHSNGMEWSQTGASHEVGTESSDDSGGDVHDAMNHQPMPMSPLADSDEGPRSPVVQGPIQNIWGQPRAVIVETANQMAMPDYQSDAFTSDSEADEMFHGGNSGFY